MTALTLLLGVSSVFAQGPWGRMPVEDPTGYKDTYKDYFTVGVAVNMRNVSDPDQIALIKKNFNSITAENDMKVVSLQPREGEWNWENADKIANFCRENNIPFTETTEFNEDVIASADIIYMTRVQRERFSDIMEYEKVKNCYRLTNAMLAHTKENLRILHPLPRVNEIAQDVDDNPKAYYFQQAQNGLYVREAIICDVLGINI